MLLALSEYSFALSAVRLARLGGEGDLVQVGGGARRVLLPEKPSGPIIAGGAAAVGSVALLVVGR